MFESPDRVGFQSSTFEFHSVNSRTHLWILLTETASRIMAKASRLTVDQNCQTSQLGNVPAFSITSELRSRHVVKPLV